MPSKSEVSDLVGRELKLIKKGLEKNFSFRLHHKSLLVAWR